MSFQIKISLWSNPTEFCIRFKNATLIQKKYLTTTVRFLSNGNLIIMYNINVHYHCINNVYLIYDIPLLSVIPLMFPNKFSILFLLFLFYIEVKLKKIN